ncbi:MAG: sigma-70 family RNA polymerase sigma factor [Limisphaerales bacterium]
MKMSEDATLLREYVENSSEPAFTALVERYVNLVYAAAWRIANQDSQLAQDVAQSVFTDFAVKARALPRDAHLGGWLYRHASFLAANAVRKEQRRRTRERQACEMNMANDESAIWSSVSPLLDEAMRHLGAKDGRAVVLRFFEQKSFVAVGEALGISEEAARKRVDRALEKLRGFFARRGLSVSAAVLGSALESYGAAAAPAGLASMVASAALAGAAANGAAGCSLLSLMIITKTKIAAAAITTALAAAIVIQSQENSRLQRELRQEAARLETLRAENERLSQPHPVAAPELNPNQLRELARLRAEVGGLKDRLKNAKQPATEAKPGAARKPSAEETDDPADEQRKMAIAKMDFAKQWTLAFFMFAQDHQGACPTNFDQAAAYFHQDPLDKDVTTNQFQLFYQGTLAQITNPANTIVLGETEPLEGPSGGWLKAYGFADGHSEYHMEPDGNFALWESQHIQPPAGQ